MKNIFSYMLNFKKMPWAAGKIPIFLIFAIFFGLPLFADDDFDIIPGTGSINIYTGSFFINGVSGTDEKVKVEYIMPVDKNSQALQSANNVVFYAPYAGDNKPLHSNNVRILAVKFGLCVFSLNIKQDFSEIGDLKNYYIFKSSGWHELVFAAHEKIISDWKLKYMNLLVMGTSAGGSMAELLAAENPGKIDAIAMTGGHFFKPFSSPDTAVLALNTWGCDNIPYSLELKEQASAKGIQILCGQTPAILKIKDNHHSHHSAGPFAWKLMQTFIAAAAKLRDANGGVMPPPRKWPVSVKINGERQYLPSKDFETLWALLPHEASALYLEKNPEKEKYLIAEVPQYKKARAVVLFVHDPTFFESTQLMDNLFFLAGRGCIAVSVKPGSDEKTEYLKKIQEALDFIMSRKAWKELPVYVIGSGSMGVIAAEAAFKSAEPKRIARVTTLLSDCESSEYKAFLAGLREKSDISLRIVSDNKTLLPADAFRNTETVLREKNGPFLGKWWFYELICAVK